MCSPGSTKQRMSAAQNRQICPAGRVMELTPDAISSAYERVMDPRRTSRVEDCLVSIRTPSRRPLIRVKLDDKWVVMPATHIVLAHHGCYPPHSCAQGSHICNNRYCVNPDHLIWQLPWDNCSRNGCHYFNYFDECPHDPPCIPCPIDAQERARENLVLESQTELNE